MNSRAVRDDLGDIGPAGIVGEASPAVARPLGIPSDANSGGVGSGVTYVILPGSGSRAVPDTVRGAGYVFAKVQD